LRFEARLKAITKGGKIASADGKLSIRGASEVVLLIAMATSYQRFDKVDGDPAAITSTQIIKAAARGFVQSPETPRRIIRRCSAASPSNSAPAPLPRSPPMRASAVGNLR
jgi:alpha-L-fucosidase 2